MEIGTIGNTAEDLIGKCLFALGDPQTDQASLQELLAECSASLRELVAERRMLLDMMRSQIAEIAELVAAGGAVWPEEVARLEALSRDIRSRAALLPGS